MVSSPRFRSNTIFLLTEAPKAELEKLGPKFRLPLRIAKDERWERHKCTHKGVYADDCIVGHIRVITKTHTLTLVP